MRANEPGAAGDESASVDHQSLGQMRRDLRERQARARKSRVAGAAIAALARLPLVLQLVGKVAASSSSTSNQVGKKWTLRPASAPAASSVRRPARCSSRSPRNISRCSLFIPIR